MRLSAKGAAFVRAHEGFRSKLYLDPIGIPTIGVGFTWRSRAFRDWWAKNKRGKAFKRGASMTRQEADDALRYLFAQEYGKAVNKFLGKKVPQHVFDAMASMTFNCGPGCLKWKWAAAAKRGNYGEAARRLRTTAVTAGGRRLAGLVRRRKEEAALLEKGIYSGHSAPVKRDAMADGVLVRGKRGPAVAALIRDLSTLGYYDGALDDAFGRGTEAAVLAFQRDNGIEADAKAGKITLGAIKMAIATGMTARMHRVPEGYDDLVNDVAASDRVSTTNVAAGLTGLSGAIGIGSQVSDAAYQAKNITDTMISVGPWVLLLLVCAGGAWWIWRERTRKAKLAQQQKVELL